MTGIIHEPEQRAEVVWYRNVRVMRRAGQIVALVAVVSLVLWLFNNLVSSMNQLNIGTDFGFLSRPTQFQIPFDDGFNPRSPVRDMVLVGVKNTFLSSFFGIVLASVLGLIIGVARLSSNWLVAKTATVYVETLRNIPPLIVIIFFGAAIFTFGPFPVLSEAMEIKFPGRPDNLLILSNTRWGVPSLAAGPGAGAFWLFLAGAVLAAVAAFIWRTRLHELTGAPLRRMRYTLGSFAIVALSGWLLVGDAYSVSWPVVRASARSIQGGFVLNYGFMALTLALGMYTASHIAEIIRGSILAVPKGQSEAANAIALSSFQRYRYVVLPQALRIAVPPVISQYLNLVKNTSLGVAVAYAEITSLTISSIGNGRPAPQSILVLMGVYLTFSLAISFLLNIYNRRIQLVER